MTVSVFDSISNTTKPNHSSLKNVLSLIKSGGKIKERVLEVRGKYKEDKEAYKRLKTSLPVIMFNGTFNKRSKDGLVNSSGIAVLDFDNIDLQKIKDKLSKDPYVYSFFLSPSGAGYKALMKIPIVKTDEEFKEYFAAIQKRYPELDESGKDISRACFFSYDPDIYVNTKAVTFQDKVVAEKEIRKVKATDWKKMSIPLNKIAQSIEGEQHNVLLKMSNLAGEYVKQGKVDREEAVRLLMAEFEKKNPDKHYDYEKTIRDGITNSLANPMRKYEVEELERLDVGKGKCYFTLLDVEKDFFDIYEKGRERGVDVGWKSAQEYMSIKLGTTSYVYALPYSGKTQWWNEVLVNLSKFYGWKHAILSPETGTPADIYAELVSIYSGKNFTGEYKMSEQERKEAREFIEKHFIVVDPSDKGLNIDDVFDQVDGAEREYGVKIHTITIDPWNELDMDLSVHGGREDKYLERVLTRLRQNAHSKQRHNCIITHVRDMEKQKDGDQRYYPVSSPNDVAGGRLWWRKGMQMISVYRPLDIKNQPLKDENGEPYQENETHIYIQKSKPKGVGKVGMFKLYYDWKTNRYYEILDQINLTKEYSRKFWEDNSIEVKEQPTLSPNEDFDNDSNVPF